MKLTQVTYQGQQYMVQEYKIIGTDVECVHVYEPSSYTGPHHTISSFCGHNVKGVWGDICTKRSNCELPVGAERSREVRKHFRAQEQLAKQVVAYMKKERGE